MDTLFTPVSYDHREIIEDEIENGKTVKVFFFNSELRLDGVEGRIEKLVEWPGHGWFIKLTPEALIRIDRIITVNGRPGPAYDEYDSYANACLDCKGGYDLD